ncbi:MAG TPA: helix-hairpin-helix domain-containing protein [Candidatus Tumulicola sp.]
MTTRIALVAGALLLAAFALWHPAPQPAFQTVAAPSPARLSNATAGRGRGSRGRGDPADEVVYVAGAVRHPGLYRVRAGDRAADAIARAGGLSATADASGVNLAARAVDGVEIYVPVAGEAATTRSRMPRTHSSGERASSARASIAPASVDVNVADARALGSVPGIGRSIAARVVEMRERYGAFASFDELLDVAGMTQTRLDRAAPFLRPIPSR